MELIVTDDRDRLSRNDDRNSLRDTGDLAECRQPMVFCTVGRKNRQNDLQYLRAFPSWFMIIFVRVVGPGPLLELWRSVSTRSV